MKGNPRSSGYARQSNDFYVEPRFAVDALLDREHFDGLIWDPACGSGNIPKACLDRGLAACGSDIIDRGCGVIFDFLIAAAQRPFPADNIVSNPPFGLAEEFARRSLAHSMHRKVALLVRLAFLEGQGRRERLFKPFRPARVWVFSPRISMPPGGQNIPARGGSTAFCWIVWEQGYEESTLLNWIDGR